MIFTIIILVALLGFIIAKASTIKLYFLKAALKISQWYLNQSKSDSKVSMDVWKNLIKELGEEIKIEKQKKKK
jgi:hypothetical protein